MNTYFPTGAWAALSPSDVGVTRFLNVHLQGNLQLDDDRTLAFGNSGIADAYVSFDGTDLNFFDVTAGVAYTLTQLAASGSQTLDQGFDNGKLIDGSAASGAANAFSVGGAAADDKVEIYHDATNGYVRSRAGDLYLASAGNDINLAGDIVIASGSITSASGAISFGNENLSTTGTINVAADNVNITVGASGATDSKIYFDGAGNLMFYDSNLGVATSLTDLASGSLTSPAITGSISWTDAVDEVAGTFTFGNITNDGIDFLANSMTTGNLLHVKSTTVNSGTLLLVESVDATMTTGFYFEAYNGAATVFGVKRYGEVEIAGSAAADMLTITAGNVQVDDGKVEIDTTQDIVSYIKRNNAVGTNAVFEIEQTHATGGIVITVDQNATGDVNAVVVENAGTGFAVSTTATAAGGRGFEFISAASATGSGFLADGTTGGAAWIGAAATGLIQAQSDGALAHVGASLLYLAYSGNAGGANQTGSCLNIVETGAASGASYSASINTTNNNGLQIAVGAVTKTNLLLTGVASQTASIAVVDGVTANWIGAADVGMLHLKSDGALANAAASLLYSTFTGNAAGANLAGACAYFVEGGAASGTSYAVGIVSTNNNGLNVQVTAAGKVAANFGGGANATASIVTIDGITNNWIGAATTGMLHLTSDGALVADGSLLRIASSGDISAANDGFALEIVETGAAQATSYAVRIASTNNEALHVDAGTVLVDETLTATQGIITIYAITDVADPPTQANMVTAFGAAAAGKIGIINDAGAGTNVWLCASTAASWYYAAKLTIGA